MDPSSSGSPSTRACASDMLLTVGASASCSSHPLLSPVRTNGGAGAAPRSTGAAKFRPLTTPLQRSSSFIFGCACSSAPTPGDEDSDRDVFDVMSLHLTTIFLPSCCRLEYIHSWKLASLLMHLFLPLISVLKKVLLISQLLFCGVKAGSCVSIREHNVRVLFSFVNANQFLDTD
jgi:hypothetical protein